MPLRLRPRLLDLLRLLLVGSVIYGILANLLQAFLNMLTAEESRADDGNAFHNFAPRTRKKFSRKSSLVQGIDRGMNDCCCRVLGA